MDDTTPKCALLLALEALDGDREAEPLLSLQRRRKAAKEEADLALAEARGLVAELERENDALGAGLVELEERIIALAEKRDADELANASCTEPVEPERIREIHGRIERVTRSAIGRARAAASAKPGAPIPVDRLRPGFAAGVAFRAPIATGVKSARGEAQRMIEAHKKRSKADPAEE